MQKIGRNAIRDHLVEKFAVGLSARLIRKVDHFVQKPPHCLHCQQPAEVLLDDLKQMRGQNFSWRNKCCALEGGIVTRVFGYPTCGGPIHGLGHVVTRRQVFVIVRVKCQDPVCP